MPKSKGGLGFHDIVSFNKALLAKQGWRLLSRPNSLLATVLKSKYYPHSSFLEAKLGSMPSFTWRSIIGAQDLLKSGVKWKVGTHDQIQVWRDSWLPVSNFYTMQSPQNILLEDAVVADLMNLDPMCRWNGALVDLVFLPHEAEMIKSIPLSPLNLPDRLVWKFPKQGVFSVRNAYHLEFQRKFCPPSFIAESSNGNNEREKWWKVLWKMKCPNKVKMFCWRF